MKIKSLLFGVLAAAAFASCSDSPVVGPMEQPKPIWDAEGKGFLAFSIQMPKDNGTRANDNFNEGLESEYKVSDVALLLFLGPDEENAIYEQYVSMDDIDFGEASPLTNITLDKKWVARITGMDLNAGDKIYALAVVNGNGVFDNSGNHIGGVEVTGKKFKDIRDIVVKTTAYANLNTDGAATLVTEQGILMLNAPLCDVKGSTTTTPTGAKVTTLQDVTLSVKPTETEAREAKTAAIYVERAVAKVTVTHTNASGTVEDDAHNKLFDWTLNQWRLDHTNKSSYVIRNMSNFAATFELASHANGGVYRMIGAADVYHDSPISMGDADLGHRYRTYFAVDPNYNTTAAEGFNAGTTSMSFGSNQPQYCAENVFDVAHQIWGQTTRVLVKATLTPADGDSYYAKPGENKFYSKAAVQELAFEKALAKLREAIAKFRGAGLLSGTITLATSTTILATDGVQVVLPVENITVVDGKTDEDVKAVGVTGVETIAQLKALINSFKTQDIKADQMGISYYSGGASYYQVRIKHFGDDLTPWNDPLRPEWDNDLYQPSAGGIDHAYPSNPSGAGMDHRDCNYLGRYGVLRNNWYEINLTNVVKIGYPNIASLELDGQPGHPDPNTPDDHITKEQWINAEVNILSWAKRFQNNNLGED